MNKTLVMDPETREMRLIYTDTWDGQHERTEYRVLSDRAGGRVLRGLEDFDGKQVHGHAPNLYVKLGPWGERTAPVWTEDAPVRPTVKIPCSRATNRRRKCQLCQDGQR